MTPRYEGMTPLMRASSHAIQMLLVASVLDRPRAVAFLLTLHLIRHVANYYLSKWAERRPLLGPVMLVYNTIFTMIMAHVVHWNLTAMLYIPFQVLIVSGIARDRRQVSVGTLLGVSAVVAWFEAVPLYEIVALVVASAIVYLVTDERATALTCAVDEAVAKRALLEVANRQMADMNSALVRQEKMATLGLLAAGIAHEINNPMAVVTSSVRAMRRSLERASGLDPDLRAEVVGELLPDAEQCVERVNAIVADIRSFARSDVDVSGDVDLETEVTSAVRMARTQLRDRIDVSVALRGLPRVRGRAHQLGQVFLNLLVNAAQAIEGRGAVKIGGHRSGDQVVIDVEDSGSGMTENTLEHLFEPFRTTKCCGEGLGLGLFIVQKIVESHGGTLAVESTLGSGTRFTVSLPVASLPNGREANDAHAPPL